MVTLKKIFVLTLSVFLLSSFTFAQKSTAEPAEEGKVLNIWTWNDEFKEVFENHFAANSSAALDGVTVKWNIVPLQDNAYINQLDKALANNATVPADERVDLFLADFSFVKKYNDSKYTLDLKNDIGISEEDLVYQVPYVKQMGTNSKNQLKAVSWQACPGGLIYRRSIAKKLFGTDDPKKVQQYVSDWNKFSGTAKKAKSAGFYMCAAPADTLRVFYDNIKAPLVDKNMNLDLSGLESWMDLAFEMSVNGYNMVEKYNDIGLWSYEWMEGMKDASDVFCYFGPGWFYDFILGLAEDEKSGDWAVCKGPQGFSWGGSYIYAAAGSDNKELIYDILYKLTCDTDVLNEIFARRGEFVNHTEFMKSMSELSSFGDEVLGGQNPYKELLDSALSVDKKNNVSAYDEELFYMLETEMKPYFSFKAGGALTKEQVRKDCLKNFYRRVKLTKPELNVPKL